MNVPTAVVFALLAPACLASGGARVAPDPVETHAAAQALDGPFATRDALCATLRAEAARLYGWKRATCDATAFALGADAPLRASVLRVEETPPLDPRTRGSGAFFLAVEARGAWFVMRAPLDIVNGGAGHTFVPEVVPDRAVVDARGRVRLELVDTTVAVCNVCEGAARDERRPARTERVTVECAVNDGAPSCAPPRATEAESRDH